MNSGRGVCVWPHRPASCATLYSDNQFGMFARIQWLDKRLTDRPPAARARVHRAAVWPPPTPRNTLPRAHAQRATVRCVRSSNARPTRVLATRAIAPTNIVKVTRRIERGRLTVYFFYYSFNCCYVYFVNVFLNDWLYHFGASTAWLLGAMFFACIIIAHQ